MKSRGRKNLFQTLTDLSMFSICKDMSLNPMEYLLLFSTSYVTGIFQTRTFSNSMESIFLALSLALVSRSYKVFLTSYSSFFFLTKSFIKLSET